MKIRRYTFTALIAVLLWPLWLGILSNPLFSVLQGFPAIAAVLICCLFASTLAGVWVVDGFYSWSSGTLELFGPHVMVTRMSIACATAIIFCIPLKMIISSITNSSFGYADALFSQGLVVVGSVWLAAQIVDMLVHHRKG